MDKIVRPTKCCSQKFPLTSKEVYRLSVLYEISTSHKASSKSHQSDHTSMKWTLNLKHKNEEQRSQYNDKKISSARENSHSINTQG